SAWHTSLYQEDDTMRRSTPTTRAILLRRSHVRSRLRQRLNSVAPQPTPTSWSRRARSGDTQNLTSMCDRRHYAHRFLASHCREMRRYVFVAQGARYVFGPERPHAEKPSEASGAPAPLLPRWRQDSHPSIGVRRVGASVSCATE